MAKKIVSKKKISKANHIKVSKPKARAVTSDSISNKDTNLTEVMGATAGEKGIEFHLKIDQKGKNQKQTKGKLANKKDSEIHLYIGSKGGDKHNGGC